MEQPRASFEFTLLDQRNRPYVNGQSSRITSDSDWSMVGAGVVLATIIGVIFVLSGLGLLGALASGNNTNAGNQVLITLLTGAGTAFLAFQTLDPLRTMAADRRLAREGQILPGAVTSVETRTRQARGMVIYALGVSYSFKTPQGQTLTGTTGVLAPPGTPPPARGAPLAILYLNEKLYRAL